jgi:hypothetical protein
VDRGEAEAGAEVEQPRHEPRVDRAQEELGEGGARAEEDRRGERERHAGPAVRRHQAIVPGMLSGSGGTSSGFCSTSPGAGDVLVVTRVDSLARLSQTKAIFCDILLFVRIKTVLAMLIENKDFEH